MRRSRPDAATARPARRPSHRAGYPLLALGLLGVYLPTLAPGATFTDGPEITVAVHTLGVIHPTGYPLFTLLAHAFTRLCALPLLTIVKVELFDALCAVAAAWLVARMTRMLLVYVEPRPGGPTDLRPVDVVSLVVGWFVGTSPILWGQVRIAEVYPFQMLLVCAAGYAWLRFEVTRQSAYAVLAALPMGMGLAHHVTMVYMLPAALLYLLVRRPWFFVAWLVYPVARLGRLVRRTFLSRRDFRGAWAFPVALIVGALPLASYGYLVWANAHTTGVPWGDVHDWESLYAHATGRQYQRFLEVKELTSYWRRIQLLPVHFDKQFLPAGTALFFPGIVVLFRRSWRFALFLLAYLLFNVGHGVYYAVGDYANYLLPAVLSCGLFIGVGLHWLLGWARRIPAPSRRWATWLAAGGMAAAASLSLLFYATRTKRLPPELQELAPWGLALPLGLVALGAVVVAIVLLWRDRGDRRPLCASALPRLLLGGLAAMLVAVTAVRGREYYREVIIGESYGEELAANIPPGSVLLTQGDGFLFTMWYEHHVHDRGTDFVTLDMGNLKTPWYQRYLYDRYPPECDPRKPEFAGAPERYAERCGSYRQRLELVARRARKRSQSYASLGLRRSPAKPSPAEVSLPIVRGNDSQCADQGWRSAHGDECRCYLYGKEAGVVEEDCIHSAEEGGIAPRWPIEVLAHRIIEDSIRERYVFERNMYTHWDKDLTENKRLWDGPSYQRVPGQYDLLNRGRYNQIVFHADLDRLRDPCGRERAARVELRPLERPGTVRRPRYRETALPNDRATLLKATYLTALGSGTDDEASRRFTAGDTVYLKIHWFESHHYAATREGRRGDPLREGVRVCYFDPNGQRLAVQSTLSGRSHPLLKLETKPDFAPGRYLVQACSVGEVGRAELPLPATLPCARTILEYEFELER